MVQLLCLMGGGGGQGASVVLKDTLSTYLALTRPQSMTYLMPLIVTEVSAMLVDTTTFLEPCENVNINS